jgi:hypothetical protein
MVSPRTWIRASLTARALRTAREHRVEQDQREQDRDHRRGRAPADALRATRCGETLLAGDERDRRREHHALEQPREQIPRPHRPAQLGHEGRWRDIERGRGDGHAAEDAHDVGEQREQRRYQREPEQPRHHQVWQRHEPERAQRVDLLRYLHRAELGGEGRSRASADDDRRHQRAQLAHHGEAHEVGDEDVCAELLELHGALKRHHEADQKVYQDQDRHRIGAGALHRERDVAQVQALWVAQRLRRRAQQLAEEVEHAHHGPEQARRRLAHLFHGVSPPAAAPAAHARAAVQGDEPAHLDAAALELAGYPALAELRLQVHEQRQAGPVDQLDRAQVDAHTLEAAPALEHLGDSLPELRRLLERDVAGERDAQLGAAQGRRPRKPRRECRGPPDSIPEGVGHRFCQLGVAHGREGPLGQSDAR